MSKPKLESGKLAATPAALRAIEAAGQEPECFVEMHLSGCWGDVSRMDWKLNDAALVNGERILSSYTTLRGTQIWVITEADRSVTTILLPEEY
jgi:hypothetical protein